MPIDITCIADLHGFYPKLEGGDLLIVAGDLTARDAAIEHFKFHDWLAEQKYRKKILIAGNHDNWLEELARPNTRVIQNLAEMGVDYLCDSGCQIFYQDDNPKPMNQSCLDFEDVKQPNLRSLKVWGSPWTKTFAGMNEKCKAFTVDTEEELAEKFKLIPDDIDILITHSPPYGVLDELEGDAHPKHVGSKSLTSKIKSMKNPPKIIIFGHVHEAYGFKNSLYTQFINASHVNECYEPVNPPVRLVL